MTAPLRSLSGWQVLACVLGAFTALVPGISFSDLYTGMNYISVGGQGLFGPTDPRVRVTSVQSGSPAWRAGFQTDDIFLSPTNFGAVQSAGTAVQQGEKQVFRIKRGEAEMTIQGVRPKPELVSVWYASAWDLVAGGLFLGLSLLLFATAPLARPPLWRSSLVMIAGFGMAVGFALEKILGWGTAFQRFPVCWRWQIATGDEWYFQQSLIGIAAGLLLAILGAIEIRKHLTHHPT